MLFLNLFILRSKKKTVEIPSVRALTLYLVFCSAPFAIPGFSRAIPLLHVAIKRLTQKGDYAMTQTAKHTPGPWQDNDAGLIYGQVSGDDDEAPFVCDVCNSAPEYTEQERANAAFIIRACNSHQVMLALLEGISRIWSEAEGGNEVMDHLEQRLGAIRHVIAKATE
jgi:hypothetical protein